MKKFIALVVMVFVLLPVALMAEVVASKTATKYHDPACKWASKIKPESLVKYKTDKDAAAAGLKPCKTCKSPAK